MAIRADTVSAIGVKATDSEDRDYLGWVGGLPRSAFEALGFRHLLSYEDPYFRAEPAAVPAGIAVPAPSRFHLMLLD